MRGLRGCFEFLGPLTLHGSGREGESGSRVCSRFHDSPRYDCNDW